MSTALRHCLLSLCHMWACTLHERRLCCDMRKHLQSNSLEQVTRFEMLHDDGTARSCVSRQCLCLCEGGSGTSTIVSPSRWHCSTVHTYYDTFLPLLHLYMLPSPTSDFESNPIRPVSTRASLLDTVLVLHVPKASNSSAMNEKLHNVNAQ